MAAHVFDAAEPSFDSARQSTVRVTEPTANAAKRDAPMFAAQPAVFERMHQRQGIGARPLIGLAVGAVVIGGLVFAMSRHNPHAHGATGIHATSQPALASTAATPVPAPSAVNPAPVKTVVAAPAPKHLR